ncbi:phosphotransferase family protein [Mycobacterium sp. pUA109]|uniref:phosphotransferase family protein n=1 Tax=Mycobacterium sp. pUA109 TaxID=3238982 RepID=UPI00351B0921
MTDWFTRYVGGVCPPLTFDPVPGGRSNLTYIVIDDAGNRWVLRRPPTGNVLPSAHNVLREWAIQSRLQHTGIPLPVMIGRSSDHDVTGADFYVMSYVDGVVLDSDATAERIPLPARAQACGNIVESLAAIHRVDCGTAEFDDLRRPGGYLDRQLRRWIKQLDASGSANTLLREVHGLLARNPPPERWTGLVHGDFRPGNMILGTDGTARAVLDWELCAIGDVLADLGWLAAVWTSREVIGWAPEPEHGFWPVDQVIAHYHTATGRDVSDIGYYQAFALWRLGCIADGVYQRYQAGVMGDHDVDLDMLSRRPDLLAELSRGLLR